MSIQSAVNNTISSISTKAVGAAVLKDKLKSDVATTAEASRATISEALEKIPELDAALDLNADQRSGIEDDREIIEAKTKGTYYPFDEKTHNYRDPKTNKFVSNEFVMEETHSMEKANKELGQLEKQRKSIVAQQEMFKLRLERAQATLAKTEKKANRLGVKI